MFVPMQLGLQLVELVLELLVGAVDRRVRIGRGDLGAHMVSMALDGHLTHFLVGYPRISLLGEVHISSVEARYESVESPDLLVGEVVQSI